MSKESVRALATRQRRGVIGDWLLGAFVSGLVVLMLGGIASPFGILANGKAARTVAVAATPAELVTRHTQLYCGDIPPQVPAKGALPTC